MPRTLLNIQIEAPRLRRENLRALNQERMWKSNGWEGDRKVIGRREETRGRCQSGRFGIGIAADCHAVITYREFLCLGMELAAGII